MLARGRVPLQMLRNKVNTPQGNIPETVLMRKFQVSSLFLGRESEDWTLPQMF